MGAAIGQKKAAKFTGSQIMQKKTKLWAIEVGASSRMEINFIVISL